MITEPKLELLAPRQLSVDSYAQREYKDDRAQTIADRWTVEKRGVFKVSRRDSGGDWVVDGQHRRGAMLKLDKHDELVPCLVYEGLTIEEEAFLFLADNADNWKPTAIDIYRLSLVAKDPVALAIQSILDEHGLHVSQNLDQHSIAAVGSLRWLYDHGGVGLIDKTLTLVEAAWGQGNRDARDGQLLKGLGKVLTDTTGARLDTVILADKLAKSGKPTQLIGTARTHRQATGMAQWLQIAHVIVGIYNKSRTSGRVTL